MTTNFKHYGQRIMCDVDVSNTIIRKDSFIGLKVAIHELSKNFNSLDLSEDEDCISTQNTVVSIFSTIRHDIISFKFSSDM